MKKIVSLALGLALLCTSFVACGSDSSDSSKSESSKSESSQSESSKADITEDISASGSSALYPLADLAATNFMDMYDVTVSVEAGGSGTGLNNVSQGISTIGNSDIFAEEKLEAGLAAELVDHKVCTVTMAAVVNPELGINNLTKQQLTDIFTGKVTNWKEVGGEDLEILLITRPSSSGTRALFEAYGMTAKPAADFVGGMETDNSGELTDKVKSNKGAIGYVAMSYYMGDDELVALSVDGVEPTLENTYNGSYTIWGYEHMYTKGEATGTAKAFIDYMMGDEFATVIEDNGYGAASKLTAEALATHEVVIGGSDEKTEIELDGDISASGSSALYPLADLAATNFMDMHDVTVSVEAGGSGTGLNNVSQGISTIGNSDIFAEEKLEASLAAELVDYKACTVTMAAVVNPELGITDLTKQQLTDIFTGKVTNWSEVGGEDLEILLITRPSSSGTRALFEAYGMTEKPAADFVGGMETDNSGELTDKVKSNKGAIGYVAMSYYMGDDELVALSIDGVEPSLENTYSGAYAIWGYEHMYTKGEATGTAKAFIDYMMGDEFASEIEANGYGATSKLTPEAIATHE